LGRNTKIKALGLALVATLALAVASHAELWGGAGAGPTARQIPSGLRGHGQASGFYPGGHQPVWVRVRNPFSHRARVRWIRTSVGSAGPGCSADNLVARRSRGLRQLRSGRWRHVLIPARQWRRVKVRARMRVRAPDACQGVTFPLRFRIKVKVWQHR
jgi:hypothetical protein